MRRNIIFALTFYIAILCIPQYATAQSYSAPAGDIYREEGIASWYGPEFDGRPTASGEIFNSALFTAAHPSLPFGTFLIVTNRNNNRQVTVKVNDRGPFVASRSIDLSKAAAEHLDMVYTGTAPVIIETLPTSYLQPPQDSSAPAVSYEPQSPATIYAPEPEPLPEPATPTYPYPPITVNVYPSAQPPQPEPPPQAPTHQAQPPLPPPPQQAQVPTQYQAQPPFPPQQAQAPTQYQAQPPYPPQQPQAPTQYQTQPPYQYQVQPPYPPQPQYPPQSQYQLPPPPPQYQSPPQPQYQYTPQPQYQPPQSTYPFPAPILPPMHMPPYQETYTPPPPVQPSLESFPPPAPAVRLIPAINPLPGTSYRLQVGSYKAPRNAVDAFEKLKGAGLSPAYEQHGEFYRVVLAGIPGTEVQSVVDKLGRAGFREAIIRVEH